ncbi:MAG: leucyl aminopeptidase [Actinobacteria bacterium]|nr:leucyl aminopeptidase [Actinomycetota bacterium]
MQPQVVASDESAGDISCDVLVVGARSSSDGPTLSEPAMDVDSALDGYLTEHLTEIDFKAKFGEMASIPTMARIAARSVLVVGLGKEPTTRTVRRVSGSVARRVFERSDVALALHSSSDEAAASIEGFLLGSYTFTKYRSEPHPSKVQRLIVTGADADILERGQIYADATTYARDLINEPGEGLTPQLWAGRARELAEVNGLTIRIYEKDELAERGFGGILGVNKGSVEPPALIELRYEPEDPKGKIVLVGKGITFDSGGLSLKDPKGMETMKTDMSGGAAVCGVMSVIKKLAPRLTVIALIPATENMPGGNAIRPGDVITHYGGRTSEVLNTDAEGRLVLGDALMLGLEEEPDAIVDIATLTGGIVVALGQRATGFFANDDGLAEELNAAADEAGELMWRMPLFDEYRKDLDSEVADIKNSGPRWGSPIIAAMFLKDFVPDSVPWAHLDIAGPARSESDRDELNKGGTGVGTRTLLRWVENRARA